jgi:Putative 2OG-Fe(II) oxygenase
MSTQDSGIKQDLGVKVDVRALFSTPVVVAAHPEAAAINGALGPLILARAASVPSTRHSNLGGWQSTWDFEAWGGEFGARLLGFALALGTRMTMTRDGKPARPAWRANSWANVNRRGHGNEFHTHPGSFWSGVYYVDDGYGGGADPTAGGELELADPRGPAPAMYRPELVPSLPGGEMTGASATIRPVAGHVILFPAWLSHAVRPYAGDGVRISVAFNLSV